MTLTLDRPQTRPALDRRAYDLEEITRMGPFHIQTLRNLIVSGELKATKIGKRWIVTAAEVARLLGELGRGDATD